MSTALTYDLATRFLGFLRVDVDSEPGDLNLLCLKGLCLKGLSLEGLVPTGTVLDRSSDAPNVYNDTIALVFHTPPMADGISRDEVECFVGTVDPGRVFTQDPTTSEGCAHLTYGQHLYTRGTHRGHPALVSANGTNRVWRDRNKNFKPDVGECVFEGAFGVNIHAGGDPKRPIEDWSAGCLNIAGGWDGAPYTRFLELVGVHSVKKPIVRVTVWRGDDLLRFAKDGPTFKPTLTLGIKNPWVAELQEGLRRHGVPCSVDGDWRDKTTDAVVAFQRAAHLTVDGWVGDETWAALSA